MTNAANEMGVFERVIFDLYCQPFDARIETGPFRQGPALQHAIHLQAEIVMQPPRCMLLNDEAQSRMPALIRRYFAARFRGPGEVTFAAIFVEAHYGARGLLRFGFPLR